MPKYDKGNWLFLLGSYDTANINLYEIQYGCITEVIEPLDGMINYHADAQLYFIDTDVKQELLVAENDLFELFPDAVIAGLDKIKAALDRCLAESAVLDAATDYLMNMSEDTAKGGKGEAN